MTAPAAMTWGQIHVGDTVRGADGRVWTVGARLAGPRWVIAGEEARFVLRLGDREVSVTRRAYESAVVVDVSNHRAVSDAVDATLWEARIPGLCSTAARDTRRR